MNFPSTDPIPIPAPVWLMKLLSLVTLALHFAAVMILVGSLVLVIFHSLKGKDAVHHRAAAVLARRLPTTMTFVINLGVPPLLFLQVLYGRAVYTSSVLIAVFWISIIFQLMLAYWLLYRTQVALEKGKAAWIPALISLIVVFSIGQVYAWNMTLMLRPEVWQEMYANSPQGLQSAKGDPTMAPRLLFVLTGGLVFGGLWALVHSTLKHLPDAVKTVLAKSGGLMALLGGVIQLVCGYMVVSSQNEAVRSGLGANPLTNIGMYLTIAGLLVAALIAGFQGFKGKATFLIALIGSVFAFLGNAGAVIVRDGIRDLTLKPKGLDVWDRIEASNWSVIGVFLLLFVIMIGVIIWLLRVMAQATPPQEETAI